MKLGFTIILLLVVVLTSCASPSPTPTAMPTPTPVPTRTVTVSSTNDETEIKSVVENFGKKLQMVSLQSPTASQQMQEQYAEFVSPALLQAWMSNQSQAPGRVVSSPWPDRIEITSLTKTASDKYAVTGSIIEITSVEVGTSNAADKVPVQIGVQKINDHWLITEYTEKR